MHACMHFYQASSLPPIPRPADNRLLLASAMQGHIASTRDRQAVVRLLAATARQLAPRLGHQALSCESLPVLPSGRGVSYPIAATMHVFPSGAHQLTRAASSPTP
jgi:hypothetical protein